MQLIDKDALVVEIERIYAYLDNLHEQRIIEKILSILNTLEVKEVDLEEKATQLSQKYFPDEENIWARANIEARCCKSACMEMAEWLKAQKGE